MPVHAFTLIDVIVVVALVIPTVHDRIADAFAPHIDTAGHKHLLVHARGCRRGERGSVRAVGDLVIFPSEVVQPLGHDAGEGLCGKRWRDLAGHPDGEHGGLFAGGEVVLENEFAVGKAPTLGILRLRGDVGHLIGQHAAGGVLDRDLLQQRAGQGPVHLAPRHGDGLRRARDREVVGGGDYQVPGVRGGGDSGEAQSEKQEPGHGACFVAAGCEKITAVRNIVD